MNEVHKSESLLDIDGVDVHFNTPSGRVKAISDVSISLAPGEIVGLVGESGSGKSVTGMSVMRILPAAVAEIRGSIRVRGEEILAMSNRQLRTIRGGEIAMIFQDSLSSLDPVSTVGKQIVETIRAHSDDSARDARTHAIELLRDVGIPDAERRFSDFPHQLSGGMRQRVMIAIALAGRPSVIIADEPTTALDVTIQAQILDLLRTKCQESQTALLFITHDLGVVAELCSRVVTMYAGEIVEDARVDDVLEAPRHPYTAGLIGALPSASEGQPRLNSIPGRVPSLDAMPEGCRFAPRCSFAQANCVSNHPEVTSDSVGRVRCHRFAELDLPGVRPVAVAK